METFMLKPGQDQVYRLRDIRQKKLNRLIVKIKKNKHQQQQLEEDVHNLKQGLDDYKKNRLQSQMKLREEFLKKTHFGIKALLSYQAVNSKLLEGEANLNTKIATLKSDILDKQSNINILHEKSLKLNKKIEGLTEMLEQSLENKTL